MKSIDSYKTYSKGYDVRLIIYYIALVLIGWITIYSTCYVPDGTNAIFDFSRPYGKQLIWIGTSILLCIAILLIDKNIIQHYAYHFYLFCLVLMILVLFIGTEISGAKAWIKIGEFSIQPVEFMKVATALTLAKFFNEGKTAVEKRYGWLISTAFILIPIVLVMLQHDAGSALVFFSFILLFYREGLSGELLLLALIAAFLSVFTLKFNETYAIAVLTIVFIVVLLKDRTVKKKMQRDIIIYVISVLFVFSVNMIYENAFEAHQKERIASIMGKTSDPKGADFNLNQSKIAIGSGGFFGKGYLKGTQTKLKFVPEQSTDFIFCAIGEEWGFMGTLVVFALFLSLIIRILRLSENQRVPFVRYYGYGIAGIIIMHFFINIGMTIGLLPIIGIPLPFLSYGGSSLWAFTTMLFIFIRLNDN
ncbi:MAG: rod shape-determining protein RodA [Bacteroidales bacterium]|nr:rod shape-determining protein RodA [Bacteroidales bacterium]MBR6334176.1 rod shape-determining protein RodA [Bacteroidales bacterium]